MVFVLCRQFAAQKYARRQKFGMKALVERVRWEVPVHLEKAGGYRINNNYTALLARDLLSSMPFLVGYLELRQRRS